MVRFGIRGSDLERGVGLEMAHIAISVWRFGISGSGWQDSGCGAQTLRVLLDLEGSHSRLADFCITGPRVIIQKKKIGP